MKIPSINGVGCGFLFEGSLGGKGKRWDLPQGDEQVEKRRVLKLLE